jgi:hypothetical protein
VDHDLLSLERRIEVRDDANDPARLVADAIRLGRRAVLAPFAEGTLVELGVARLRDQPGRRTRTSPPVRRDDDLPAGERVSPEIQRCRVRGTA